MLHDAASSAASTLTNLARLAAAEEALRLLMPLFLESPAELRDWTTLALGHYLRASEVTGVEVDSDLFAAIAVQLAALEEGRGSPSGRVKAQTRYR